MASIIGIGIGLTLIVCYPVVSVLAGEQCVSSVWYMGRMVLKKKIKKKSEEKVLNKF